MADVTGNVIGKLSNLSLTRSGNEIHAEWKVPAWLKESDYGRRATAVHASIDFICNPDNNKTVAEVWQNDFEIEGRKSLTITNYDHYYVRGIEDQLSWLEPVSGGEDLDKPYDRNRFYPKTTKKCSGVKIGVQGINAYQNGYDARCGGPFIYQTFGFKVPQKPTVTIDWDEDSNYYAAYTIDANPGDEDEAKNNNERYDTRYRIMRQDNLPNSGYASKKAVRDWTAFTADEASGDIGTDNRILGLSDGQWLELTLECYSRGMAGDSATTTSKLVASRPCRATIKSINVSSLDMVNGIVTVKCTIPSDSHRWTTKAKLQRAKDVNPKWDAQRVAADGSWEDVTGMVQIDDEYKDATWDSGFCDSVAAAYPSGVNLKTWYRVITENDLYFDDNAYMSTPVEAKQLFREQTATNDRVFVESLSTNDDATCVKVLLGWPNDDSTGTEVSWSTHPDAWESSEQPSTALVTWEDMVSQGSHANSASFTIYGVEQGQEIYVKARRYYQNDDGDIVDYSPYATATSALYPFVPAMPPKEVQLVAPDFVARGSDIPLTWTFQSDAHQTAWAVYKMVNGSKVAITSGEDAYGSCTVPASLLTGDSVTLVVSMTTGSTWADSAEATVRFADPPTIAATFPSATDPDYVTTWPLLMEQPMALACSSDTGDDMLHVRLVSDGIAHNLPDRELQQVTGEPVFDAWVIPTWTGSGSAWYTTVVLPANLDLIDRGTYTWEVTGLNQTSGLLSTTVTGRVKVRWAHQAHLPGAGSTITTDGKTATVTPANPDNIADADVFDLYRVTPDSTDLIAEGVRYGSVVTDIYAPYGNANLSYRIATRTVDGDVAWRDVAYEINGKDVTFDWNSRSLQIPYNLVRQDSWSKDFEQRAHLDGSIGGGWNPAVTRSLSLSTDMVKFNSESDQRLVRELANYTGPVFVRLPNGCAFEADVQVSNLDESYNTMAISASFSASQVDLTDEFRIAPSDIDTSGAGEYNPHEYTNSQILYWGKVAPAQGNTYTLINTPSGTVLVELTASTDYYSDTWSVANTVSGTTLTLGALSSELQSFIADAVAEDGSIRLMARYDVAQDLGA